MDGMPSFVLSENFMIWTIIIGGSIWVGLWLIEFILKRIKKDGQTD